MDNDKLRKLYYIEEEYDAHSVIHILENILKIEYKRERLYKGQIISVKKEDYHNALSFITSELLRREPESVVNWIDYYGKQRPYNKFCYGTLKIKDEYVDTIIPSLAEDKLTDFFNESDNTLEGKAPITTVVNDNGYISFEGDIIYDNKEKFWSDLRYYGLVGVFVQRREYCLNVIKENNNTIYTYADSYFLPVINGKIDESLNMQYEFAPTGIKRKIKK